MISERLPAMLLEMTVNGRPVRLEIEYRETLLSVLRDRLGLTGAKLSCDLQVCGACTVLVDGMEVSACTYLAYEARGKAVQTIEGLSGEGEALHPLQEAFVKCVGLQCGFCTSGMILTATALLAENPGPTREEIAERLRGNICRCTGYYGIVNAVEEGARRLREASDDQSDPGEEMR